MCCMYIREEEIRLDQRFSLFYEEYPVEENSRMKNQSFQEEVQHLEIAPRLNGTKSGVEKTDCRATWISLDKISFSMESNN